MALDGRLGPAVQSTVMDMTEEEAKPLVVELFRKWCQETGIEKADETDAMAFFIGPLRQDHAHLLAFVSREEKWALVCDWLTQAGITAVRKTLN